MIERIKEIGRLSREYAYATEVDKTGHIDDNTGERLSWFDLYERKFAELLEKEFEAKHFSEGYLQGQSIGVKETARACADMCQNRAHAGTQGSFNDAAILCSKDIKQHFGVE